MMTSFTAQSESPATAPLSAPSATPRKQLVMTWVSINGKLECRWNQVEK